MHHPSGYVVRNAFARGDMSMRTEATGFTFRSLIAILCAAALVPGDLLGYRIQQSAQKSSSSAAAPAQAPKIAPGQLDSLVAPIALYPDPLVAQLLAASSYPLEVI